MWGALWDQKSKKCCDKKHTAKFRAGQGRWHRDIAGEVSKHLSPQQRQTHRNQILLFSSYFCGRSHLTAKVKTVLPVKNMVNLLTNICKVWQLQFVLKTLKGLGKSETSLILDCNQANWRTWKIYQGKVGSIILNLMFRDEWHLLCYRSIQFDLLFLLLWRW